MEKIELMEKNGYLYKFKDLSNNIYLLDIDFLEIETKPEIGDIIYIDISLLNPNSENYSNSYIFGKLSSNYGRNILEDKNLVDVMIIVHKNQKMFLKRLYG